MTIAIGFLCRDGVLLCADTEHTRKTAKTHHNKVEEFEVPAGRVCFALSGASPLAWTAIEKCRKELQKSQSKDLAGGIEAILDREYRRNVLSHPDFPTRDYQFLIGAWLKDGNVNLYSTNRTAMTTVPEYECIGGGAELARYLIRPHHGVTGLKSATALCAYVLACVKDNISGCGGMSIFRMLRKDGNSGMLTNLFHGPCEDIEASAKVFDGRVHDVLMWMTDIQMEDKHFEVNVLELFVKPLIQQRRAWTAKRDKKYQDLKQSNPLHTPEQIKALFDDWFMGFAPMPAKKTKKSKKN